MKIVSDHLWVDVCDRNGPFIRDIRGVYFSNPPPLTAASKQHLVESVAGKMQEIHCTFVALAVCRHAYAPSDPNRQRALRKSAASVLRNVFC